MKTTFKKTLLAAALASVSAGAFAAADVTGSTQVAASLEGNPATITVASVEVVLGAEYAVGDVLTFSFSGGALDPATLASSVSPVLVDGNDTMTLGLLSSDENGAVYRVTELTYDGLLQETTVGGTITLDGIAAAGLDFEGPEAIAADGVTFSYSAKTNTNQPIDTTGSKLSQKVIFIGEELVASVDTKANAVIDVEEDRKLFTPDAADTIVFDTALITQVDSDGDNVLDLNITEGNATVTKVTYVVNSDFSWVVDTAAGTAGIQPAVGTFAVTNCPAVAVAPVVTATSVTFSCGAGAANTTLTIDPKQGGAAFPASLSPKSFSTDVTFAFTDDAAAAKTDVITGLDSGSWTLNGSQVRVPYMVVNNSRFGIIANVTNHGSKDGSITLDVFGEDGEVLASNYAAGTSEAGSVTSVAAALKAALVAAGKNLDNTTKFSFQVITNVPEEDVQVYAAYTDSTTSERAIVNNDGMVQGK